MALALAGCGGGASGGREGAGKRGSWNYRGRHRPRRWTEAQWPTSSATASTVGPLAAPVLSDRSFFVDAERPAAPGNQPMRLALKGLKIGER